MTSLRDMLAERSKLRDQMNALHQQHATGTLPDTEQRQWDTWQTELRAVEQRIERQSTLDDVERRMHGTPLAGTDTRWDQLLSGYSISKALLYRDGAVDSGREKEASAEIEKRTGRQARGIIIPHEALATRSVETRDGQVVGGADPSLGGVLNPDRYRGDLYTDRLRPQSVLARAGVTWISDCRGKQVIPKLVQSGAVQFVDENEAPTESEAKWESIELEPHTAAAQMRYSRRTLINATPSIDALLRDDLSKQIAGAIDRVAINGDGAKEPLGLLRQPGLQIVPLGPNGAAPTPEQLIALTSFPDIEDATVGGQAWLTNAKVTASVSTLKDGAGAYMFLSTLPGSLLGYPMLKSSTVPDDLTKGTGTGLSAMIYGAWASMLVALYSGVDILSDPYTAGASGQVRLYAFQDLDVGVRHIESFAAFTDVKTV